MLGWRLGGRTIGELHRDLSPRELAYQLGALVLELEERAAGAWAPWLGSREG